ncbi:3971_t:CDS:2, partial [Entrophospora sp. SA101]
NEFLSLGIINKHNIRAEQKGFYKALKQNKSLNELSLNISIDAQLNKAQRELIQVIITRGNGSFIGVYSPTTIPCSMFKWDIHYGIINLVNSLKYVWKLSSYQRQSPSINERSFSHDFTKPMVDFFLLGATELARRWDGCVPQSTSNHYDTNADNLLNHIKEDKFCLGRFMKDAWDHIIKKFETTMDVYVMDLGLRPLQRMMLIDTILLPIDSITNDIITFCDKLLKINWLIRKNIRIIKKIDKILDVKNQVAVETLSYSALKFTSFKSPPDNNNYYYLYQ